MGKCLERRWGHVTFGHIRYRREHPKNTSERVTWPSVTTGDVVYVQKAPLGRYCAIPVVHAHIEWNCGRRKEHPQQTLCTITKKKNTGENRHAQNILPVRAASGQGLFRSRDFQKSRDWRHFRWKDPARANVAQLPVTSGCACVEHTSEQGSGHATSGHIRSPDFR
jgi:hypothetical protein